MNIKCLSAEDESRILDALAVKDLDWDKVSSGSSSLGLYKGDFLVGTIQPNPLNILFTGFLYRDKPDSPALWELLLHQAGLPSSLRESIQALSTGKAVVRDVPPHATLKEIITELNLRDHKGKLTVEVLVHDKVVRTGGCLSITYPNSAVKTLHVLDLGKPFTDSCGNGVNMFVQGLYSDEDLAKCRDMRVQQLERDLLGLRKDLGKKEERLTLWKEGEISVV